MYGSNFILDNGTITTVKTGLSLNTWYTIHLNYSTTQFRVQFWNGMSWDEFSSFQNFMNSGSPNKLYVYAYNPTGYFHVDTLSTSDYMTETVPPSGGGSSADPSDLMITYSIIHETSTETYLTATGTKMINEIARQSVLIAAVIVFGIVTMIALNSFQV